ncbi:MAG TPA: hypothetical protein VG755_06930 [Nannocystaceae bacterium]|nr:hypothetical protein [Nannocystaceae bacterium]
MPRNAPRGRAALALVCAFAAPPACVDEPEHEEVLFVAHEDHARDDGHAAPAHAADRHTAACNGYCEAFARACDQPLGYADEGECLTTCEGWSMGEPGERGPSVACHTAMLPGTGAAFGSCIAAGPMSPICGDA